MAAAGALRLLVPRGRLLSPRRGLHLSAPAAIQVEAVRGGIGGEGFIPSERGGAGELRDARSALPCLVPLSRR